MAQNLLTPQSLQRVTSACDSLRVELAGLDAALNKINEDLGEYMQLEKTIEFIRKHKPDGFKTQVDIGTNTFMEAQVDKIEPILINVGLNIYLELELAEALKFLEIKIKILNKESDVIREESLKKRAEIKILLMYLAEKNGFVGGEEINS